MSTARTARTARPVTLLLAAVVLAGLGGLAACSPKPVYRVDDGLEPGGQVITRADISALGARDALEVVERSGTHLRIQHTRAGTPARITQRGVSTFVLHSQVMVVVDGTRVGTVAEHLRNIPSETIDFIQILTGREAALRYGSEAGNGVILVRTSGSF